MGKKRPFHEMSKNASSDATSELSCWNASDIDYQFLPNDFTHDLNCEDDFFYENSNLETFATTVYSVPHWMPQRKRVKREVKIEPSDPDFVPLPYEVIPNLAPSTLPPPVDFRRRRRKRKTPRKPPTKVIEEGNTKKSVQITGRPVDKRLRMHCSHCRRDFWAKPTCREGRYVLNHKCSDQPRRQYVVGGWHRKCNLNHFAPCIDFVAQGNEQD